MTDLHLALFGLGAFIILLVVLINWWQERKIRKEAAERFAPVETDVLLQDEPEPVVRRVNITDKVKSITQEEANVEGALSDKVGENTTSLKREPTLSSLPDIQDDAPNLSSQAAPDEESENQTLSSIDTPVDSRLYDNAQFDLDQPITLQDKASEEEQAFVMSENEAEAAMQQAFEEEIQQDIQAMQVSSTDVQTANVEGEEQELTLPQPLDLNIDLVGLLHKPKSKHQDEIRTFLHALTDADKTIHLFAQLPNGDWQLVTRDDVPSEYRLLAAAIQLADRSGFVSKAMLDHFQSQVEQLSKLLLAHLEWLGDPDPWRYAGQLDQFCIDVDKLVGFHIVHGNHGPFTGTKFRGLAEANGLVLNDDGRFYRYSDDQQSLFSIENHDSLPFNPEMLRSSVIRGVAFKLDIPRVKNCPDVFNQMALIGQHMANHLNAILHDDNKRPVAEPQFDIVRQQLKVIHSKMVARGVVPGSPTALRLFN